MAPPLSSTSEGIMKQATTEASVPKVNANANGSTSTSLANAPLKDDKSVPMTPTPTDSTSTALSTNGSKDNDVEMLDAANGNGKTTTPVIEQPPVEEPETGRRSKRRSSAAATASGSATKKTKKAKTTASSTKTTAKRDQDLLDMTWICVACREAECGMDPECELLICEGPCRRLYHITCAGLPGLPAEGVTWHCHDCRHEKHVCDLCQEYGQDGDDVFKCDKGDCGRFFHEACLEMQNIPAISTTGTATGELVLETAETTETINKMLKFTCPAHWCWTCTQEDVVIDDPASADATTEDGKTKAKKKPKGRKKKGKSSTTNNTFASKTERRLFPCLDCPISYHLTCIPPLAKFHELALLCHEHAATKELPALNMESSLQGNVEAAADQTLLKMHNRDNLLAKRSLAQQSVYHHKSRGMTSKNPFFPARVVADRRTDREQLVLSKLVIAAEANGPAGAITKDEDNKNSDDASSTAATNATTNTIMAIGEGSQKDRLLFCLPADVQEEVHAKPPPYKHIHSLKYYPEKRPKKIPMPQDVCSCVESCDDHCINRLLYVECFGSTTNSKEANNGAAAADSNIPSTATNNSNRRGTNCRLGANCGNRRLGQRQNVKKCKPQTEKGKGWGLATLENVKKDGLVQEYLGDVIDEATKEQRLKEWSIEHPNDPNFYIMCLSQGWYIDARETANLSRFINHSCDPNCILMRLNVGGYMRDGIFAIRDIKAGEFLSYDYHFDTKLGDKFICRCGSTNCRGTMMEKILKKDAVKKTKLELWNEAKQQLEKDREFLHEFEAREQRNATVQGVLPGATKSEPPTGMQSKESSRHSNGEGTAKKQEWVSTGVDDKDRKAVIVSRAFLWRNAVAGSDFASRSNRYLNRKSSTKKKAAK